MTASNSEVGVGARWLWPILALAAALFVPLFRFQRIGPLDFWWWMSATLAGLLALAYGTDAGARRALADDVRSGLLKKLLLGLLSAVLLYAVFWAGNLLSRRLLPFAAGGIEAVYGFRSGASTLRVALLIGLLIGPGEELFWRGWLQRALGERYGAAAGWLLATALYTGIHLASGNPMLLLAALVCGLYWGWLYLRYRSLVLVVVSHTAWDLTVFLLFPLG
ncbi:MAG: CPBP family intramembrane metalloprotease [Kiritimatiellaeota bacterium]|nr:CPBP family intramembrane metalloprotease [Kiritimatiellota bacterium]